MSIHGPVGRGRAPLLLLGMVSLLAALWAGLLRLGWAWPTWGPALPAAHGPLMVSGFLGALISLERAVAVNRRWAYAAPLLTGLGGLSLLVGAPPTVGAALIFLGSLVLIAIFRVILGMHTALFSVAIAGGAVLWAVGNLFWLFGRPIPQVVWWWVGFLVLTIAGERLELSRLLRLGRVPQALFVAAALLLVAGAVWKTLTLGSGGALLGVALLSMAAWLLRYDIAWRRLRAGGQARFTGASLLSGYVWLGLAGMFALFWGNITAGPYYDATLHAIFLGFVFAMIFGHAPIIFPAVLQAPFQFSNRFYSHLVLLHLTLILRVTGDLTGWWTGRLWGGLLNALVLLLFLANTVTAVKRAGKEKSMAHGA